MLKVLNWLLALALSLSTTCVFANFAIFQINNGNIANTPTTFTHVQIGGAALITGMSSIPAANLLYARNDQYGCYKSVGGGQWQQLVTVNAMPASSTTLANGSPADDATSWGCEEAVGSDASTTDIWIGWNGKVFVSTNSGTSFVATCYAAVTPYGNSGIRSMGRRIAVDPANANIAYMSTPSGSLRRTTDKGTNCSNVGTLAAPTSSSGYLVAFDASAGTLSGASCPNSVSPCTKNVYVSVYGTGVYKSTDAGATWTLTTGTPTTHWYMIVDPTGVVWFADNTGGSGVGTARKYSGTSWSNPSFTDNTLVNAVAYDPNACTLTSNCHVTYIVCCGSGKTVNTTDGGTTWVRASGVSITSSDVGWISNTLTTIGIFPSGAAYDASGRVYIGTEGILRVTPPTTVTTAAWTSFTTGFEGFLTNQIATSSGTSGKLIVAGWDIGCFTLTAPYTSFPADADHGCAGQVSFQHQYAIDWAAGTPTTFVSLGDNQQGYPGGTYASDSGVSTNSGSSWSTFNAPAGVTSGGLVGGCMAVGTSPTTIMWAPTDGGGGATAPYYSSNSGTSWTQISVSGVTGGWPFQYYLNSHVCAADRVTANTFYFYNWNIGSGPDAIIKCTGTVCTNQSAPGLSGTDRQFNPTIKTVPGNAGHLFLADGLLGSSAVDTATSPFLYYTDGGVTKNTIAGATNVTAFGFGAAFPGHTYPAIVFVGFYNNVYGIWRSIDWDGAKTWQNIGTYLKDINGNQYPLSVFDADGDKSVSGVFYYGTVSGVFCGALTTAQCNGATWLLKRDLDPASNDNDPMWLNKTA